MTRITAGRTMAAVLTARSSALAARAFRLGIGRGRAADPTQPGAENRLLGLLPVAPISVQRLLLGRPARRRRGATADGQAPARPPSAETPRRRPSTAPREAERRGHRAANPSDHAATGRGPRQGVSDPGVYREGAAARRDFGGEALRQRADRDGLAALSERQRGVYHAYMKGLWEDAETDAAQRAALQRRTPEMRQRAAERDEDEEKDAEDEDEWETRDAMEDAEDEDEWETRDAMDVSLPFPGAVLARRLGGS